MTVRGTMKKLSAHFPPEHPFYFKQVTTIDNLSLSTVAKMMMTTMTRGQTPMADFGLTTPAWNPSSRTPGRDGG
jgi:hypothetical protein